MCFFDKNPNFSNHVLFVDNTGHSVTYQDWYYHAQKLKALIPRRSLAVILCHNGIGSALSYLSCLQNHIVPLLLDSQMDRDLCQQLLTIYSPNYIFKSLNAAQAGEVPIYIIESYGLFNYSDKKHDIYPELALLLTTSGSTGSPKLVRQSYANIQSNAMSISSYLKLNDKERPVSSLPMHYTFGLSVINSHILVGATVYLTELTIFDAAFWDFCKKKKITSIAGVPFTYECLKRIRFFNMTLPNLQLMIQAGGKLSKTLQQQYAEFACRTHKRFIVMYGQTEATARMSYLPEEYSVSKIGSIGIAIPGGAFHIMENAHTEIFDPNIQGELCYDGPNVTLGYAQSIDDLKLGDERHGRLWTGDIAYKDSDGFYYIAGRKKRFLKIMGKRVNMDEIEQLFKNTYTSYDFACTGVDEDLRIFTTAPQDLLEECSDFLLKKTGLHPATFTITTIDAIPKNSSGKTQYTMLKSLAKL
ncbi:MAG: AMP-binding protein [Megasphaera sp.]|jgi:acyl-CoA synthetase (AMP-forming)/AMP-acid ligase II|uniref:AMP-binding protein n=1 Tax=Megasphaera sueciensis TaxID=349094 RepID=UPI002ACB0959|nr:AMP-binding protein [Megasphaera sp.]MCI1823915.1 AMP-binding protein [Megasphaera sp.]